jgi:hypothetical protein
MKLDESLSRIAVTCRSVASEYRGVYEREAPASVLVLLCAAAPTSGSAAGGLRNPYPVGHGPVRLGAALDCVNLRIRTDTEKGEEGRVGQPDGLLPRQAALAPRFRAFVKRAVVIVCVQQEVGIGDDHFRRRCVGCP